jgi:hypothetical protein
MSAVVMLDACRAERGEQCAVHRPGYVFPSFEKIDAFFQAKVGLRRRAA